MPPPPPPANVYPCLDWVPQGVAKAKPQRLKLTSEELKAVLADAKSKELEARRRLGQAIRDEDRLRSDGNGAITNDGHNSNDRNDQENKNDADDDVIMKEYGLDTYDEENNHGGLNNYTQGGVQTGDISEDEAEDGLRTTRGPLTTELGDDMATLTYHASNEEDPYLKQAPNGEMDDDKEEEEEFAIKPTDNLVVAGHVSREESSIEVYVYDNEQNEFYLHHDIIQADYPCCVKWVGHARNQSRNVAAAGYMNPEILLWDLDVVDVLEPMEVLSGHKDAVIDICWNSHVKNIIASGSADQHVRIWNLDECKSISNTKLSGKVSALDFGIQDHFLLLAGDLERNVNLIDTRTSSLVKTWRVLGEVERVRWIPIDNTSFLVSDDLGYIYYFDLRNSCDGQPTSKFRAHQISVTGLEFSPTYKDMLVTASADDTIKVWDTKTAFRGGSGGAIQNEPTLVKELTDMKVGRILSLRMCPNSPALIAVGGDSKCNSFKTYDLTTEKEVKDRFVNQQAA